MHGVLNLVTKFLEKGSTLGLYTDGLKRFQWFFENNWLEVIIQQLANAIWYHTFLAAIFVSFTFTFTVLLFWQVQFEH